MYYIFNRMLLIVLMSFSLIYAKNAGILPFSIRGDPPKIYFLLGQERSNKSWSDFGGIGEKQEDCLETALREFTEETREAFGIFARKKEEYKKLSVFNASKAYAYDRIKNNVEYIAGYTIYFAHVDFLSPQELKNGPGKDREKIDFEWVDAQDFITIVRQSKNYNNTFYHAKKVRPQFVGLIKSEQFLEKFNDIKESIEINYLCAQSIPIERIDRDHDELITFLEKLEYSLYELKGYLS